MIPQGDENSSSVIFDNQCYQKCNKDLLVNTTFSKSKMDREIFYMAKILESDKWLF